MITISFTFVYFFRLTECTICGKKVAAIGSHMKVHEKKVEVVDEFPDDAEADSLVELADTPGTKSKRAAARK